jgi:hypothetical protein
VATNVTGTVVRSVFADGTEKRTETQRTAGRADT